jgi:tetratricopeptide (TPR) repeat protein
VERSFGRGEGDDAAMRRHAAWAVLLAACAGASPDPDAMARDRLESAELDAEGRRYLQQHVENALAALAAGRYESAEENARLSLDLDPRAARARAVLGLCLLHRAQAHDPPDLALMNRGDGETLRALHLQPRDPVVAWLRAAFLGSCGHLAAAAEAAEQGLAALPPADESAPEPARVDLLAAAARFRYELGEKRLARPHLAALLDVRPDDAQARFRYGICLLVTAEDDEAHAAGRLAAAAEAFARAAELKPDDREAWLAVIAARMRAAERLGKNGDEAGRKAAIDEAVAACGRAAERFPQDGEPWFRKGVALEALGESAQAEQAFLEALQRDGEHLGALLDLASLCAADRRAEAEALLRRALSAADHGKGRLQPKERDRIQAFLEGGPAAGKDDGKDG